jgi:hypothetical protein
VKLQWGPDDIGEVNATKIAPEYRKVLDTRFRGWAVDVTYTAETFIRCSGQADAKTKMDAIEVLLKADGKDLKFLNDDGSNSTNSVTTASTLGGTRCTGWAWLPEPRGAQFQTGRFLRVTFEYRVAFSGLTGRLADYSETVEIDNALPRYAVNEAVNGVAAEILQTIALPVNRATQRGFAVGVTGYPVYATVAPDVFVGAGVIKLKDSGPVWTTPKYRGSGTEEYRIEWVKEFISNAALVPALNPWPAGG